MKRPWLLVFDLDGTLVDSSLDLCLSVNAALQYMGANELSHPRITSLIGNGAATLVQRSLEASGYGGSSVSPEGMADPTAEALGFFLRYYRQHKLDHTCLYEGVLPALQTIRQDFPQLPMAVLTNKPVGPAREICAGLQIAPFFFDIAGGDTFATKKPDAEGLQMLMRQAAMILGRGSDVDASGVLVIGDSDTDVHTARNARARSLGCTYGLAPEKLQAAGPDLLCHSAREWPEIVRRGF